MDEPGFRDFLKKGGRSKSAIERCLRYVNDFEHFLHEIAGNKRIDHASAAELEAFVNSLEASPGTSAKGHLWGLRYYFTFCGNEGLADVAAEWRQQRIKRAPFALRNFRGVHSGHVEALANIGIKDVDQMLRQGKSVAQRRVLATRTGVPVEAILEFVKLADLARIQGLKGIRARLYHDAGIDSVEKLAGWKPSALRIKLITFVEETGFEGMAPLPREAESAVASAKKLPKVVEYEEHS